MPTYVGDGMLPVPAKLAAKVRRWEVCRNGGTSSRILGRKAAGTGGRVHRHARKVTDIFTWVQCFGTYVAVVTPVEPHLVPELMAYMGTII